jgi:HSP20 family protein
MATQRDFDRLFREAFSPVLGEGELSTRIWASSVDIYENGDSLVLKAELPGVNPDDVEIRVEDNTLYLKGERKFEKEVKEQNYHRVERSYGTFTRTFSLPNSIDADKVAANFKDGVLTLTMPKKEEAKPKTIKINVSKNWDGSFVRAGAERLSCCPSRRGDFCRVAGPGAATTFRTAPARFLFQKYAVSGQLSAFSGQPKAERRIVIIRAARRTDIRCVQGRGSLQRAVGSSVHFFCFEYWISSSSPFNPPINDLGKCVTRGRKFSLPTAAPQFMEPVVSADKRFGEVCHAGPEVFVADCCAPVHGAGRFRR